MLQMTTARVLAIDIGGTKIAVGIGSADGQMTRQASAPTHASDGADAVLDRMLALARGIYDEERAAGGDVQAVGLSTLGIPLETHIEFAPNIPGWDALRIPERIADAFDGLPAVIGNDVKAATEAEMLWGSLRGVRDGIYLNLGSGVASGIVSGGRLVRGGHGAAGEVGYSLFRGMPEPRMAAEGAAPFEEWFGGIGAANRLAAAGMRSSVAEVVAMQEQDPDARSFLDDLWTGIAVLVANLCTALDPTVVSLGGGYMRGDSGVLERVEEVLARAVPYPPEVVRARFGADASLRGAAAMVFASLGGA